MCDTGQLLSVHLKTRRPRSGAQSGSRIYQSLQTLSESKFAKLQISHFLGGGGACGNQFSAFDAKFKFAKIYGSLFLGGGGVVETNFQF